MKKKIINTCFFAGLLILMSSCLQMGGGGSASGTEETLLHAYFQLDSEIGCYGDPEMFDEGATVHLAYTFSIEDEYTMRVCVTVPNTSTALSDLAVLSQKTIDFYGTNDVPGAVGSMAGDLTAVRLPVAEGSSILYMTGSGTPCPNGYPSSYLVGYLDMELRSSLKYIMLYDPCGMLAGAAESPYELERRINKGF
jgi:hypothetical protein